MSSLSYGFDLWRKIHPLFFCDYLELGYLTPMQLVFKLQDNTKKREPDPSAKQISLSYLLVWLPGGQCFDPVSLLLCFCIPIHVTTSLYSLLRVRIEGFF